MGRTLVGHVGVYLDDIDDIDDGGARADLIEAGYTNYVDGLNGLGMEKAPFRAPATG